MTDPTAPYRRAAASLAARGVPFYWAPASALHALAVALPGSPDPYPDAAEGSALLACDDPSLALTRAAGRWVLA